MLHVIAEALLLGLLPVLAVLLLVGDWLVYPTLVVLAILVPFRMKAHARRGMRDFVLSIFGGSPDPLAAVIDTEWVALRLCDLPRVKIHGLPAAERLRVRKLHERIEEACAELAAEGLLERCTFEMDEAFYEDRKPQPFVVPNVWRLKRGAGLQMAISLGAAQEAAKARHGGPSKEETDAEVGLA
jgi:hypothetical protein